MKKKSMQVSLMDLIIAAIVALIIIALVVGINSYLKKANEREYCRLSIMSMQAAKVAHRTTVFHLDCPMQFINVKKTDLPKDQVKEDNFIHKKYADAMYDCWYEAGKGEYTDFAEKTFGDKQACFLCSRISFEKQNAPDNYQTMDNFGDWLKKNSAVGSSLSYFDFLSYKDSTRFIVPDNQIDPNSNYYLVFVATNDGDNLDQTAYKNRLAVQSGPFSLVYLIKEQDFKSLGCQVLIN